MISPPLQTAAGLLVDRRGKVLFGLRATWKKSWPNHWDAIGGRLEKGETAEEALVRELGEEIGVVAISFTLLATVKGVEPEIHGEMICNVFAVTRWTGEPFMACDEHSELCWFSPDELERLPNVAGTGYPEFARRAVALEKSGGVGR